MSKGLIFWLLMVLWMIFTLVMSWPPNSQRPNATLLTGIMLTWILLFLLGWAVFGFVIQ